MQYTSLSTFYLRCARHLIELYPVSWRERYSEEMLLVLEDCPPTFRTIINLIFHLFDAYAHPHLLTGGKPHILQRMRSSELCIYSAAVIFFVAWFLAMEGATTLIGYSIDLENAFFSLFTIFRYNCLLLILLILF